MAAIQRPDAVRFTRDLIQRCAELTKEHRELQVFVNDSQQRLREIGEALVSTRRQVFEELTRMDLVSPGNFGWEQRLQVFLADLVAMGRDPAPAPGIVTEAMVDAAHALDPATPRDDVRAMLQAAIAASQEQSA